MQSQNSEVKMLRIRTLPGKTLLAVVTFAAVAAAPQVRILDTATIPRIWDMPVPKLEQAAFGPSVEALRADRLHVLEAEVFKGKGGPLDHFYETLARRGTARVLHFGDSPTTADLITADVRGVLQKQFGNAGTGFVLIAKPWAWYNHRGVKMDSSGWKIEVAGVAESNDGLYGLGGARFTGEEGAEATWTVGTGQDSAEVAFLCGPEGGRFTIEADGQPLGAWDTNAPEPAPGFADFAVPAGASVFRLRVTSKRVKLFGIEFRRNRPGVLYSSLGINGANITLLSRVYNYGHLAAQLQHYRPDLVVLAYGTNESGFPNFVDTAWAQEMRLAVKRVRSALPAASILLMSPMDRGEKAEDGTIRTIGALPRLVAKEQEIAAEMGVAFFNTYQAMGGAGTMGEWYAAQPRLVGADYIHPLPAGAKIVGELLYSALDDGYNEYKRRMQAWRDSAVSSPTVP
jgi:lysophospholipase L1-like esterase